jgi:hypothetical protein
MLTASQSTSHKYYDKIVNRSLGLRCLQLQSSVIGWYVAVYCICTCGHVPFFKDEMYGERSAFGRKYA